MPRVYVAVTDTQWFRRLAEQAERRAGRLDEVNFWSPTTNQPLLQGLRPGDPIFFRLKAPRNAIAGYGFFAHFTHLRLDQAWEWFGWKNGAESEWEWLRLIGQYRGRDLAGDPAGRGARLACTLLRDATLWPRERWMPWGEPQGWQRNIVRGKTERDPARVETLLAAIHADHAGVPEDLTGGFVPVASDSRRIREVASVAREGQGAFRARLLDAYGRRCAITGEHTEVVLDAAHIQPYLGPRSNHVQNGLLLTKEFHALFDKGYVTVTPEHEVRVSPRLRRDWENGHRYYPFDERRLVALPDDPADQPSPEVLAWHGKKIFLG